MNTERFCSLLKASGYNFWSGVPCSYLKNIINWAIKNTCYIAAVNEGDAIANCAGASLGGAKPVAFMQNSGLTNALSPLTSLTIMYGIPLLGFVSLRADEPQHQLMGTITESLLDLIKIPWAYISEDTEEAIHQIQIADQYINNRSSFFFVVRKGMFDPLSVSNLDTTSDFVMGTITGKYGEDSFPMRREVLLALCQIRDASTVFVSTTGYTSRELFEINDLPANFYMLGSLGCVSPLALGLALTNKNIKIVVIDGDGSLLMRLGTLAATARYAPSNMLHILLDNGVHESTGAQQTVSGNTDFTSVAHYCGYPKSIYAHNIDELINAYKEWVRMPVLTFIHLRTAVGTSKTLSRPEIEPAEIASRFRDFVNGKRSLT